MEGKLFTKNILIGRIDLTIGDYHMGGLFGIFTPNENYLNQMQKEIQAFNENKTKDFQIWDSYDLRVELINGYVLEPVGGITLDDYYEMFDEPIQITLIGVACDIIDEHFK